VILIAIAVWGGLVVGAVNVAVLGGGDPVGRAIILMADGLVLGWCVLGGAATWGFRDRLAGWMGALPLRWPVRFVVLCTLLALLEEVVTTTMTNLAPFMGVSPEQAHITASANYLHVVLFHSVVVFVPMFAAWALMLKRWDFSPLRVMLLFGLTGSLAEASINPSSLFGGFWVFVYGLMVYLPACTVPADRGARPPRWWHHLLAVFLPFLAVVPVAPVVVLLRRWLGIPLFEGT
jgi:hypothetical protein